MRGLGSLSKLLLIFAAAAAAAIALLAPTLVSALAAASTPVVGGLYADTVWTKANSPYLVTGNVTLFPGYTLTIEPGVEVRFSDGTGLEVRGALVAEGTATERIGFTAATPGTKGSWSGVSIRTDLGGSAQVRYADLSYANTALSVQVYSSGGPMSVADSTFINNITAIDGYSNWVMAVDRSLFEGNTYAVNSWNKRISGSIFRNNQYGLYQTDAVSVYGSTFSGHEVALWGRRGDVSYCEIVGNTTGVRASYEGFALLRNAITNNHVGVIQESHGLATASLEYNNILSNSSFSLQSAGASNTNAPNNWWGTTDTAAIDAGIYDGRDDVSLGLVIYQPLLSQPASIVAPTPTPSPTATAVPSATPTRTLPPTATATRTPTVSPTVTTTSLPTATRTPTLIPSPTATGTPTLIPSPTATRTPSAIPSPMPTATRTPTPPPTATVTTAPGAGTYEEDSPYVRYDGAGWSRWAGAAASGGWYMRSTNIGDSAIVRFLGTGVRWHGFTYKFAGMINVFLDGVFRETVTMFYEGDTTRRAMTIEYSGLPYGVHELRLVVQGSSGFSTCLDVDAFTVLSGPTPTPSTTPTPAPGQFEQRIPLSRGWNWFSYAVSSYGTGLTPVDTAYFRDHWGTATLDGSPLPVGSLVEAFSPRGDLVGTATVVTAGYYPYLRVYGEDPAASPAIPGMRVGEAIAFRVNGYAATAVPAVLWKDNLVPLRVDLAATSVLPVETVLASIAGQYDYVLGEAGTYAPPPAEPFLNTLNLMEAGKGYFIRTTRATELVIRGRQLPASSPLQLGTGWRWVGYLPTATQPLTAALASIQGKYDFVLGETGTYAPPPALQHLNTLSTLEPGEAYLIRMAEDAALVYPAGG